MNNLFAYALPFALLLSAITVQAQGEMRGFVIDAAKPYVYLKFDHAGSRRPLSKGEPDKGLWLRLVNNSRVPIIVAFFNPGTGDPGVCLYDQVIPMNLSALPLGRGFRAGEKPTKASPPLEPLPDGYSPSEVGSTMTVAPGHNLLFSVPVNHIGPSSYLQVKFFLDVPSSSYGVGPSSFVSFNWQDIPENIRVNLHP